MTLAHISCRFSAAFCGSHLSNISPKSQSLQCVYNEKRKTFFFLLFADFGRDISADFGDSRNPLYKGTNRLFHPHHSIFRNEGKEVAQSVWMGDWGVWVEQCHVFLSIRWRMQIMEIINLDQKCRRWKAKTCASQCGRCWKHAIASIWDVIV